MRSENLLVELGTEELPPKALPTLAKAFADNMRSALEAAELSFDAVNWLASPRRLAIVVTNLAEQQADKQVEKRGPAVSAAFDDQGNPTKAASGWARANGIEVNEAERLVTDKGEWLLYKALVKGQSIEQLLAPMLSDALKKLPIPKPMRWGAKTTQFIRPVHSLTLLYGEQLLSGSVLGLESSRRIFGHRFHGEKTFELDHADHYESALKDHYVLVDFATRRHTIEQQLKATAQQEAGEVDWDDSLLDEVTALVEWPVTYVASFDESFLTVPKEALIYTMKDDQKYFPLLGTDGQLKSRFLFVSNIDSQDPKHVIEGNEKVIRPRLADARFFFENDQKRTLESRLDDLESVLFQKQLGSLKDKSERIAELAKSIAEKMQANPQEAYRAGLLSKTDLMTDMVMEFPDVQGVMGMHYARLNGEPEAVAVALDEQYKPRYSGDNLPQTAVSQAVALADKFDTLVGIFGIGQLPKGDKDPFALRRAAIGVLRILVEEKIHLDLTELADMACQLFGDKITQPDTQEQVVDFILARCKNWYQEQGVEIDVLQAVSARKPTVPSDFDARVRAVQSFKAMDAASALAAANKRVANILAKNSSEQTVLTVNPALFEGEHEEALYEALNKVESEIEPLVASSSYAAILSRLAELRGVIDAYFDNVMVMADDEAVRNNRLAVLAKLRELFLGCADISLLN